MKQKIHPLPRVFALPTPLSLLALFLLLLCVPTAHAQTTSFTYQGKLTDGGNPATGVYDLQFRLFDALAGGTQVGTTVISEDVPVASGIFSVTLDFGAGALPGAGRWLEIGVRPGPSTGAFTLLSPLQPLTSTPYAVQSLNAATATNAVQLGGVAANQYVVTSEAVDRCATANRWQRGLHSEHDQPASE